MPRHMCLASAISFDAGHNTTWFLLSRHLLSTTLILDHGLNETANITPSSAESQDRIIPITYTNDPRSVLDWCDENLYHDSAGILGFDTEVSYRIYYALPTESGGRAMKIAD